MKLQQLRYIVEVAKQGMNVSDAADALYTSQPGVSKQIKLLEEELGVTVFERNAKRFVGVTPAGEAVLNAARRILGETENLKRIAEEYAAGDTGTLNIAATHTQARYVLPEVVKRFIETYPNVRLTLHQGSPMQIAQWLQSGEADIGIATEALDQFPDIVALPCRAWAHSVIAPAGHPILARTLSLQDLARYPLITYDAAFTGRSKINRAFERAGLEPNVVLAAIDADVIKTYVSLGLGLGIIAGMAFDAQRDQGLEAREAGHLFDTNLTKLGVRRQMHLKAYEFAFIQMFAPHLTRHSVEVALSAPPSADDADY